LGRLRQWLCSEVKGDTNSSLLNVVSPFTFILYLMSCSECILILVALLAHRLLTITTPHNEIDAGIGNSGGKPLLIGTMYSTDKCFALSRRSKYFWH